MTFSITTLSIISYTEVHKRKFYYWSSERIYWLWSWWVSLCEMSLCWVASSWDVCTEGYDKFSHWVLLCWVCWVTFYLWLYWGLCVYLPYWLSLHFVSYVECGVMLNVKCYAECHYAVFHHVKCNYADC